MHTLHALSAVTALIALSAPACCTDKTGNRNDSGPSSSPIRTTPPPAYPTVAPTGSLGSKPSWVGPWKSKPCGPRQYMRTIELRSDGTFVAGDRISPCPKDVACVWPGIIDFTGKWTESGSTVTLTQNNPAPLKMPQAQPFPSELRWSGGPMESATNCPYELGKVAE